MWINPDHVVSLVPKISFDGTHHILRVELKLVGLPVQEAWLGSYATAKEVDHGWSQFLAGISGHPDDVEEQAPEP